MRCPFCGNEDTQVRDSRPTEEASSIRRRRQCLACGGRFTTFERIQMRDLTVVKRSGRRTPFDRDKLMRSVQIAIRKRDIDPEKIERMVTGIIRQLESTGESDIPSNLIGSLIMAALRELDMVAYVRFASVYKNFRAVGDFEVADIAVAPGNHRGQRCAAQLHPGRTPQAEDENGVQDQVHCVGQQRRHHGRAHITATLEGAGQRHRREEERRRDLRRNPPKE